MRYSIAYGSLEKILALKPTLVKCLSFIFQQDSAVTDSLERLADALKVSYFKNMQRIYIADLKMHPQA